MSLPVLLILSVLAVYRISHMIAREDGPFDLLIDIRHKIGQHNWIGRGLNCVLCISFWLAATASIIPEWLVLWLGVAGGVMVLHKVLDGGYA